MSMNVLMAPISELDRPALRLGLLALAGGVVIGLAVLFQAPLATAVVMATTHQPERYTELSLVDQNHLPARVKVSALTPVRFRLVSHESAPVTYHYVVTSSLTNSVIAEGVVTLAPGQSADQVALFKLDRPKSTTLISVILIGRPETINFRSQS